MDHPSVLNTLNCYPDPISEETIAAMIAGVVNSAYAQGESLADLTCLLLEEDQDLDGMTRQWLCDLVVETWQDFYEVGAPNEAEDCSPIGNPVLKPHSIKTPHIESQHVLAKQLVDAA